jgi:hypothetical protein
VPLGHSAVRAAAAAEETRALAAATEGTCLSPSVELSIDRALQAGGAAERRQREGFPRQPEIVGRATEFRRILDLWKHAQEGKGSSAVITGEPGIGKTRLALELGAWYRMRLQIFPDGTSGLALDNVPLARVQGDLPLAGRYRLVMEGQSVRTKILVGRLEVWEGIRGDVDWSVLDTSRSGK